MKRFLRHFLIAVLFVVTLLLVGIQLAPALGLKLADRWYAQQGEGFSLTAGDWSFSPFKLQFRLHDLTLTHPGVANGQTTLKTLALNLDVKALLQQRVHVRSLAVDGLALNLAVEEQDGNKNLSVAGLMIPLASPAADKPAVAETDEAESAVDATVQAAAWTVQLDQLTLNDERIVWRVNDQSLDASGEWWLQSLTLADFSSTGSSPVTVQLSAQIAALAVRTPQAVQLQNPLSLTVAGQLLNPMLAPQFQGDITVNNVGVQVHDSLSVALQQLALKGLVADATQQQLTALQLNGFTFRNESAAATKTEAKRTEAKSTEVGSAEEKNADAKSPGESDAFEKDLGEKDTAAPAAQAITLEKLTLSGITNQSNQQHVDALDLQGLTLSAGGKSLLTLGQYRISGLDYQTAGTLSVGEQAYTGLTLAVERRADGSLAGLPDQSSASHSDPDDAGTVLAAGSAAQAPAESEAVTQVLAIVLAGLQQGMAALPAEGDGAIKSGAGDAQPTQIRMLDASVTPPLRATLTIHELHIGAIQPDISATPLQLKQPVPVRLVLGLDDYNRIRIDGELGLYARDGQVYPQGELTVHAEQLDLVPFNGYLNQAMGYQVERGMLNLDAIIQVNQARLSGDIKILLRNSRFVPSDQQTIARVSKQIAMPVDTALDLLRDDNGNVRLSVPLSGDLSRPDFGLNDLSRQLSKLALQQGALYYLKQSLQPYTTMITVASYAGDYLFAIRLDALSFAAGSHELADDQTERLNKVAGLMSKKTDLELRVCPFVSHDEAGTLADQGVALATQRGQTVKAYLAAQTDNKGQSLAPRVTVCKAQQGERSEVVLGVE
ncbi:DUF748 domain-containing protein [Thalassolituus sp. LLYu03]|uniref:DUF748 domain-containing protein n=1 Tax=Thalassolituus sp. LLYu03 TaxID=3421656 RepID=UPI003D2904E8